MRRARHRGICAIVRHMDKRLETKARANQGVFSSTDATALGISGNDLTTLVRRGEIVRVRRGAYIVGSVYESADVAERYRLRVLAVMRTRPSQDRASHQSALALFGLGIFAAPRNVVVIESPVQHRSAGGLIVCRPTASVGGSFGGVRCVMAATACVQVAARYGFEAGVCAMDSALHKKWCTVDDLEAAIIHVAPKWHSRVRRAIAFADALTESVGESRTRIILSDAGFTVVPQFEVSLGRDGVKRVDFLVDGLVMVEFDGLVKYGGIEGQRALADEKARESRITRMGYEFVRIVWSELDNHRAIVRRVHEAKQLAQARRDALARLAR